jgi:hypothetical protein
MGEPEVPVPDRYAIAEHGVSLRLGRDRAAVGVIMKTIADDPGYRPGMRVLIDARQGPPAPDLRRVRAAVALLAPLRERLGPLGVLVADDMHFAVSRQFAAIAEARGIAVSVFRDVADAERWFTAEKPEQSS